MPKKYSSEFKKDALKYIEDHPDTDSVYAQNTWEYHTILFTDGIKGRSEKKEVNQQILLM